MHAHRDVDISSIVNFEGGAQPPKSEHIYEKRPGYIRFIQNRDYGSDSHITFIPISKRNKTCSADDILLDKYGEAGAVRYGLAGAYNVALLKVIPSLPNTKEWIRDFLSQDIVEKQLFQSSQASTRPSLNESTFLGMKIPLPSEKDLEEYERRGRALLLWELSFAAKIVKLRGIKATLLKKYF